MKVTPSTRHFFDIFALFFLSLVFFTFGLESQEIIGFDSRFYLFAQEMWRHGASWFPTTYHEPYPDYPATSTFLIYSFANAFGSLTKFVAVLPSAIAAALTVVITYLLGKLHSKQFGMYAVLFVLLSAAFVKSARAVALDMYPALITASCFYLVYSADFYEQRKRLIGLVPLLLLGFMFRGPIGLVMPAGVICIYYLMNKDFKRFFLMGTAAFFLLLFCIALLLALAYHEGGSDFVASVLRMEIVGRMDKNSLPKSFYFTSAMNNYALTYPLACLSLAGASYYAFFKKKKTVETKFIFYCVGWALVILIGMSIPGDKKIRYILPVVPALACIAAYIFVAPSSQAYFSYLRAFLLRLFLFFPALFLLGLGFSLQYATRHTLMFPIPTYLLASLLLLLQSAALFAFFFSKKERREWVLTLLAAFTFMSVNILAIEPVELYVDRTKSFVEDVERHRLQNQAALVFFKERADGVTIKYLINMPKEEMPIFIKDEKALLTMTKPAYFITDKTHFEELPLTAFQIVASGKIGHVPVVVFIKK